jgi:hypothetical protein
VAALLVFLLTSQPAWTRVHIPDPVAAHQMRQALDKAWTLLGSPRCSAIAADFLDRDGRPLSDRLDALEVDAQTYLTFVIFVDATRETPCTTGRLAFTVPGARIVRVCSGELKRIWPLQALHIAAAMIHEMLHTLGLGENPPSSEEITRRVLARCRD